MPLLGFTVPSHKEKILSGEKRQTIRKLRKHPIKVGDHLYLYWHLRQRDCEKLGEANCTETFYIAVTIGEHTNSWRIERFNAHPSEASQCYQLGERESLDLANRDGFDTVFEMILCLMKMHSILPNSRTFFQVVRWGRLEKKEA
jgi:hypothetical protein